MCRNSRNALLLALAVATISLQYGESWTLTPLFTSQRKTESRRGALLVHTTPSSPSPSDANSTTASPSSNQTTAIMQTVIDDDSLRASAFDETVIQRYACKKFQRADGSESNGKSASQSNPNVVRTARHCLDLARLSPSAFNTQPYRIVLVHSPEQKLALAQYCLGPNKQRVLDSDCTAVFLADRQILKTIRRLSQFLQSSKNGKNRALRKIDMLYVSIFSSGYPIPRFIAAVVSFLVRFGIGLTDFLCRKLLGICQFPSLSNAETWSSKQVAMAAMTYMLACSSRGLATIPMEGINASGIRQVLRVPQNRYAIPLVVSTGTPSEKPKQSLSSSRRYPTEEVLFDNVFGGLSLQQ